MPIVDGFTSTRMIRSFEKTRPNECLSLRAEKNGRIPIFAVSASLVERDRERYIETGFDGWILKPVDFRRVDLLLRGIVDDESRNQCIYTPGADNWERGGWFRKRMNKSDANPIYAVDTRPSSSLPSADRSVTEGESLGNNEGDQEKVKVDSCDGCVDNSNPTDSTSISTQDFQQGPQSDGEKSSTSARPVPSIVKADTI